MASSGGYSTIYLITCLFSQQLFLACKTFRTQQKISKRLFYSIIMFVSISTDSDVSQLSICKIFCERTT